MTDNAARTIGGRRPEPSRTDLGWVAALRISLANPAPVFAQAARPDPLEAVVQVSAVIPSDARTAETLGTEREGTGVVIDDSGLILTIGYLILEASEVSITGSGN